MPLPPPAPVVPPPVASVATTTPQERQAMTQEEGRMLQYLRGLQSVGVELPTELKTMCAGLEQKETPKENVISHSQLNRFTCLKAQVQAVQKKVAVLDGEWGNVIRSLIGQATTHSTLYLQARGELMETYQTKAEELRQLKVTISEASHALCAASTEDAPATEAPDLSASMLQLQELAQSTAAVIQEQRQIQLVEDDEGVEAVDMDQDANGGPVEGEVKDSTGERPHKGKSFRLSPSPSSGHVAKEHLKGPTRHTEYRKGK